MRSDVSGSWSAARNVATDGRVVGSARACGGLYGDSRTRVVQPRRGEDECAAQRVVVEKLLLFSETLEGVENREENKLRETATLESSRPGPRR